MDGGGGAAGATESSKNEATSGKETGKTGSHNKVRLKVNSHDSSPESERQRRKEAAAGVRNVSGALKI